VRMCRAQVIAMNFFRGNVIRKSQKLSLHF
jgi:hypothetical protein